MQRDLALALGAPIGSAVRGRALRAIVISLVALAAFALVLVIDGKDPIRAYRDTLVYVFGNAYGFSELLVRMSPLLLTSLAVAIPSRVGLINVGGEGQLYMGAWLATAGALNFPDLPPWLLLPLMILLGFAGGALWALGPALMRAARLVNETISTLLLNYVAPLIVSYFIFGPWRSADSGAYPQSPAFVAAARLPSYFGTRVHAGLFFGLAGLALYGFAMARTRWGLEMRAIGGNAEASLRLGLPVSRTMIIAMALAGGMAGVAGMSRGLCDPRAIGCLAIAGLRLHRFSGGLARWRRRVSASSSWPSCSRSSVRSATFCRSPKRRPTPSLIC